MLTSVVLYTSANLCVKELSHLGTFQLVFLRSAVSLLLCVVYLRAGIHLLGNNRRWLFVRGLMGMIALSGFFIPSAHSFGQCHGDSIFQPSVHGLACLLFLKERVHRWQWLFLGLALLGIVMVKGL